MKILLLHSSYRIDGNTSRVIKLFDEKLSLLSKEQNVEIQSEIITLAYSDISMCRGCRICFDKGEEKCPLKDDLLDLRDKMMEADAYVIADPVYVEDITIPDGIQALYFTFTGHGSASLASFTLE